MSGKKVALDIPREALIEQCVSLATQAAIAHHEGRPDEAETHLNGLALLMHGMDELDVQAIVNWLWGWEEVPINAVDNEHWLGLLKKVLKRVLTEPPRSAAEVEARAAALGLKPTGYVLFKFY